MIEDLGAAPKWRFGLGIAVFSQSLAAIGTKLILRRGTALEVIKALVAETGADAMVWSRAYDPVTIARDTAVKSTLKDMGEATAQSRLTTFIDSAVDQYKADRDFPSIEATSRLSGNPAYGEIAPRRIWHAGQWAMVEGAKGAEHFCKELVWREFAYHLIYHTPQITQRNWREEWDAFSWRGDSADAEAWRRGMTGEPMVDAALMQRPIFVCSILAPKARSSTGLGDIAGSI